MESRKPFFDQTFAHSTLPVNRTSYELPPSCLAPRQRGEAWPPRIAAHRRHP